uniref:tetratricopeptide repeat protein 8 isoform X2 n=1 Tax=Myxine glutinosa TaxID=7769 RepID=UPI00358E4228
MTEALCAWPGMDPAFLAWSSFRRRRFQRCADLCSDILERTPYDQAVWSLKTRALTEQVYVDEVDVDEEGIAEMLLDDNAMVQVARPGTSLHAPSSGQCSGPSPAIRPVTQTGRPLTGFARPSTQGGRPGTMEMAIKTPRTAHTAQPMTASTGRYIRLGTSLFEYVFHHDSDVRNALDLASLATEHAGFKDWWWKVQLGKCYYRLALYREAEKQFKSALKQQYMVDTFLYLSKIYMRLDQPLVALEVHKKALEHFPKEVSFLSGVARIHEGMRDHVAAADVYKEVLRLDSTNVEAIACIGSNHFYSDQPEVALRYYRRLLQMGVYNMEVFNNVGLCCFFAQQFDMSLGAFERASTLAHGPEEAAEVWYNLGHVAVGTGDISLAYQCFKLALANNNDHAEAYNNLGVVEHHRGQEQQAKALFQTSSSLAPQLYEPHYNFALLSYQAGEMQTSYVSIKKSLAAFATHMESLELLHQLQQHFSLL